MKIELYNLGAVNSGSIDLSKRLNLLCGPNGTGKTYFAYAVYGLLHNLQHLKGNLDFANKLIEERSFDFQIDKSFLLGYRDSVRKSMISNLDEIFGLGKDDCARIFEDFNIAFKDTDEEFYDSLLKEEFDFFEEIGSVKVHIKKTAFSDIVSLAIPNDSISTESMFNLRLMLQSTLYYDLVLSPIRGVVMFPVERNSIYTFSKELSIRKQEIIDSIQMMVEKDRNFNKIDLLLNSKRYPLPVKEGLVVADDLIEIRKNKSEFYEFAEQIESELLHGRVQISGDGEIQFKPSKSPRKILPIQMTASIIKTMASLVVYLKHIAKHGELIIIDEPEINLHPDNQIVLTQILAKLMNKGFRLLISTHSDYIIREINNLVMLSGLTPDQIQRLGVASSYTADMLISKDDISIHYFDYKRKSSKNVDVVELDVDKNGFAVKSIDSVIESQSALAERLYYSLNYKTNA